MYSRSIWTPLSVLALIISSICRVIVCTATNDLNSKNVCFMLESKPTFQSTNMHRAFDVIYYLSHVRATPFEILRGRIGKFPDTPPTTFFLKFPHSLFSWTLQAYFYIKIYVGFKSGIFFHSMPPENLKWNSQ